MGFKKSNCFIESRRFKSFAEAEEVFKNKESSVEDMLEAVEYFISHNEFYYILHLLNDMFTEDELKLHPVIDMVFAKLHNKPKRKEDFDELFRMLKSDNAYLRNAAISFLQNYGNEAESFIKKLLNDSDKDMRIFAINILGDAKLENSSELLRECIKNEKDINVLMTAVDCLMEIGNEEDIELLKNLKNRYASDPYVEFTVNLAIERIKGGV